MYLIYYSEVDKETHQNIGYPIFKEMAKDLSIYSHRGLGMPDYFSDVNPMFGGGIDWGYEDDKRMLIINLEYEHTNKYIIQLIRDYKLGALCI